MLDPSLKWLLLQTQAPLAQFDKKNATKAVLCLKTILAAMRANTVGLPAERVQLNMFFTSKKAIAAWP